MLKLIIAIALFVAAAVFVVLAVCAAFKIGTRVLPGYRFKAKGKEAAFWEAKLMRTVARLLWTCAVLSAFVGVLVFFAEWKLIILGVIAIAAVVAIWADSIAKGNLREAARKAKELSE